MKDRLRTNAVPIQLPIGKEETFTGIIDLMNMKAEVYGDDMGKDIEETDIPADMLDLPKTWRDRMVEAIAETDEELTMKFLEGEEITVEELMAALRRATIACKITPVCCGSSYKNKGVQMMLDAVVDYMPSPLDVPPISGINPNTEEEEARPSDDSAPFAALAFKIMADPFVGKLCFFRVYSGTLESGSYALNSGQTEAGTDQPYPADACQPP